MSWVQFHSRFGCHGLSIRLPGPWQLEVWFCPSGSIIPCHFHSHIQSLLIFLGGRMLWQRDGVARLFTWRDIGRAIRVPALVRHGAHTLGMFGLFVNLERWNTTKTSAAIDLELC